MVDRLGRTHSLAFGYAAFVGITYAFSWTLVIVGVKLGWKEDLLSVSGAGPALAALFLSRSQTRDLVPHTPRGVWFLFFVPLCWIVLSLRTSWWNSDHGLPVHLKMIQLIPAILPAWILSSFVSSNAGSCAIGQRILHRPSRWSWYAVLFFPVLLGFPSVIAYAFGAKLVWPGLGGVNLVSAATGAMSFLSNILFAGLLEEPGWRGFLLDRLQSKFSPLSASLLVWLPWALWHGPIDYYRPVHFTLVQEILLRVVTLIPLTIILTWFYNRSARSIQVPVLFHAAMNTFPYVFAFYPSAWFTIFFFTAFVVIKDRMWRTRSNPGDIVAADLGPITTDGNAHPAAPSAR